MNALVLARYDAHAGVLSDDTRAAFANMWALQFTAGPQKGSWAWLNFHNAPWESDESHYWGTTLAAIAVGIAPGGYQSLPEIQRERHAAARVSHGRVRQAAARQSDRRVVGRVEALRTLTPEQQQK